MSSWKLVEGAYPDDFGGFDSLTWAVGELYGIKKGEYILQLQVNADPSRNVWHKVGGFYTSFAGNEDALYALLVGNGEVMKYIDTSPWKKIGSPANSLFACGHQLYALTPDKSTIYAYNADENKWSSSSIGGGGLMFVAGLQYLYAVTPQKAAVWYDPSLSAWNTLPGFSMESLAVNDTYLYGLNVADHILYWNGPLSCNSNKTNLWELIYSGNDVKSITAGGKHLIYTSSANGNIYSWDQEKNVWKDLDTCAEEGMIIVEDILYGIQDDGKVVFQSLAS